MNGFDATGSPQYSYYKLTHSQLGLVHVFEDWGLPDRPSLLSAIEHVLREKELYGACVIVRDASQFGDLFHVHLTANCDYATIVPLMEQKLQLALDFLAGTTKARHNSTYRIRGSYNGDFRGN